MIRSIKRKSRPLVRVGKLGIVRLTGGALYELRLECWMRDRRRCRACDVLTHWMPSFDGDPRAYDMAHIVSRGAGGSDTLENVQTLCHRCHMQEHTKGLRG